MKSKLTEALNNVGEFSKSYDKKDNGTVEDDDEEEFYDVEDDDLDYENKQLATPLMDNDTHHDEEIQAKDNEDQTANDLDDAEKQLLKYTSINESRFIEDHFN